MISHYTKSIQARIQALPVQVRDAIYPHASTRLEWTSTNMYESKNHESITH